MTVNLTVVVQLFHFVLAYLILERMLFRPAIAVLQASDRALEERQRRINQRREKIERLRFKAEEAQKANQAALQAHMPGLPIRRYADTEAIYEAVEREISQPDVRFDEAAKLVDAMKKLLVDKVAHD